MVDAPTRYVAVAGVLFRESDKERAHPAGMLYDMADTFAEAPVTIAEAQPWRSIATWDGEEDGPWLFAVAGHDGSVCLKTWPPEWATHWLPPPPAPEGEG